MLGTLETVVGPAEGGPGPTGVPPTTPAGIATDIEWGRTKTCLDVLDSDPFADKAPAETYAKLLDQGTYLCSIRTLGWILHASDAVRERRNWLPRHPTRSGRGTSQSCWGRPSGPIIISP